jgi:hypothetical protein
MNTQSDILTGEQQIAHELQSKTQKLKFSTPLGNY